MTNEQLEAQIPKIREIFNRRGFSEVDADDLTQEVVTRVLLSVRRSGHDGSESAGEHPYPFAFCFKVMEGLFPQVQK